MNKKNIVIALLLVLNIVLFSLCIHYKNDKPDIITGYKRMHSNLLLYRRL